MPTSQATANIDLDNVYGSGTPATIYAALAIAAPNYSANSGQGSIVEPNTSTQYGGYVRVAITNNTTNFPAAASGAKQNGTSIAFATSTGGTSAPVTLTYLVFITTSSGIGRIIDALPISGGLIIAAGQAPLFPAASITVTEA